LKYSPWGPVEITTGIAGDNLLNVDIRNSTQFHKDEILLPGRNFKFFLNVKYDAEKPSSPPGYYKARDPVQLPHHGRRRSRRRQLQVRPVRSDHRQELISPPATPSGHYFPAAQRVMACRLRPF
jgi:hypothetical protein